MNDFIIKLENVTKVFNLRYESENKIFKNLNNQRKFTALKNISFSLNKGEAVGLIGRNGSGKTTLLKIIAGILKPTFGKIYIKGKVVPFIDLGSGLQPDLSGKENIFWLGLLLGLSKKEIQKKLKRIISFSGLQNFINAKLRTYSAGMQVRLAFSVAVMINPDILVIDEIISVGDASFQKKSFNKIYSLKQQGTTIILASHSIEDIRRICDKVIYLEKGEIKKIGDPHEVIELYLNTIYKEDKQSIIENIDEKINLISKYKKKEELLHNQLSMYNDSFFLKFKRSMLKKQLHNIINLIRETKLDIVDLIEHYEQLLKRRLEFIECSLIDNNPLLEKQRLTLLKELNKILEKKYKFCEDFLERKKIKKEQKGIMQNIAILLKNNEEKKIILNKLKQIIKEEINTTKNKKIKEQLFQELEGVETNLCLIEYQKFLPQQVKENKRNLEENEIYIIKRMLLQLNEEILSAKQEIENNKNTNNKEKVKEYEIKYQNLLKKKMILIKRLDLLQKFTKKKRADSNIEIVNVRFLNSNKKEVRVFKTGEKFIIEIEYNAKSEVKYPVFGVGIYRDDGIHITGPNTKFHNFKINSIKGKGKVYYQIDELPFLEGKYLVTIAIHPYNSFFPYDLHDRIYSFEVKQPKEIKDYGIIHVNAKWKIKLN